MKVVSSHTMAELEAQAYAQGCSEEQFMEEAGKGVATAVHDFIRTRNFPKTVTLVCGKGNNGGDAYVAGCYLLDHGYAVTAFQVAEETSPLCRKNHERFASAGGRVIHDLQFDGVIVDGLFGTGLNKAPKEPYASIIEAINSSGLPVIAVDIPSGLNGDTGKAEGAVVRATETVCLGLPKAGLFLNDGWNVVGVLRIADFGLPAPIVEKADSPFLLFTRDMMEARLPSIKRTRHKYEAGYVVALAGSPELPGAANIATLAALRGGAGIVRLLYPQGMEALLSNSPYELIKTVYNSNEEVAAALSHASAALIGPGIGLGAAQTALLRAVLPQLQVPCVLDADALTLVAQEEIALPEQTVLTPHHGEMRRLLRTAERYPLDLEYLQICQHYVDTHHATLVLKGAPTFVLHPGSLPYVIARGDPGMATAGSGDVLTGLIAALLSQGLSPHDAALTGVYIHAVAGEHAAAVYTSYCMIATDIIRFFPDLFYSENTPDSLP